MMSPGPKPFFLFLMIVLTLNLLAQEETIRDPRTGLIIRQEPSEGLEDEEVLTPELEQGLNLGFVSTPSTWYRSNSLGQPLEEVIWYSASVMPYSLEREVKEREESWTLYKDGVQEKVWIYTYAEPGRLREIKAFEEGETTSVLTFDPQGRVTTETDYSSGQRHDYQFLYQRERIRGFRFLIAGEEQYTQSLFRDPLGRLRRVERRWADGRVQMEGWVYGPQGQVSRWSQEGDRVDEVFINRLGDPYLEQRYEAQKLIYESRKTFQEGRLVKEEVLDPQASEQIVQEYNNQGQVIRETLRQEGKILMVSTSRYDENRLIQRTVETPSYKEVSDYSYQGGSLREIRRVRNGLLHRLITFLPEEIRVENWYDGGEIFLRITYREEEKVLEEFFQDGEIIRTEELGAP
jgi:antitoxin component YwqK of YwqJK toxin-antitoxin module